MTKSFSNLFNLDNLRSVTKKGFFHLFSANILIYLTSFGSQFVVAWFLSPEQLGQIKIMQTYLAVSLLITTFGFNTSVLKLCSEARSEGQIIYIYRKAIHYILITLGIVLPLLAILTYSGIVSDDEIITKYFFLFLIALIPATYSSIYTAFLQAVKQIKLISKINILTKALSIGIIITATWAFRFNGYAIALVISYFITFILLKTNVAGIVKGVTIQKIDQPFRLHRKYALIAFITNLVGQLSIYADIFLMNYFIADKPAIGYYSFALTLTLVMTIYNSTVQQIVIPFLSEKSSDINELKKKSRKYDILNIIISSILVVILYFTLPFLITFLLGSKYDASIPYYKILLIASLFYNISAFKGYTLLGIGKIEYNLITSVIVLIISYIMSYLLVMRMGIIGLAYGKVITNFIGIFIVLIFFKLGMKTFSTK